MDNFINFNISMSKKSCGSIRESASIGYETQTGQQIQSCSFVMIIYYRCDYVTVIESGGVLNHPVYTHTHANTAFPQYCYSI